MKIEKYLLKVSRSKWTVVGILLILGVIFISLGVIRSYPVNSQLYENHLHQYGDFDRKVENVYRVAQERASEPFFSTKEHFIFNGHNPGFYVFVSEMGIRAGVESVQTLQIFGLILFTIGLVIFYKWVKIISEKKEIALLATTFLIFSPYLLYHSITIHTDPYDFFFFNLFIFLYLKILRGNKKTWLLIITVVTAFLLTQSYYMYYIPLIVISIGLPWALRLKYHKLLLGAILVVPFLSLFLVFIQLKIISSSDAAQNEMSRFLLFRLFDLGADGNTEYVSFKDDITRYLDILDKRVSDMFSLGFYTMIFTLGVGLVLNTIREKSNWIRLFIILIIAGLSWNFVFFQHSIIHEFSGLYGWYFWSVAFAFSTYEIVKFINKKLIARYKNLKYYENFMYTFFISVLVLAPIYHPLISGFLLHFVNNYIYYLRQLF